MIDTNKIVNMVKDTPLEKMDNKAIKIDESQMFGFKNWEGTQNVGRWFGSIVYCTASGHYIGGQGTSHNGYSSKENALKYAMIDFEKRMQEFGRDWGDIAKTTV